MEAVLRLAREALFGAEALVAQDEVCAVDVGIDLRGFKLAVPHGIPLP